MLRRKFNVRLHESADPLPKAPYVVISNHANFFDPWIVGHYTTEPIAIMMNEFGFKASAMTRWYLRNVGCFSKKKGQSDAQSVKRAMKSLRAGYTLLVFPEGQASWSGKTQPIYPGIERITKKVKAPLVLYRLRGNFVSKPWWSTGPARKGEITVFRKVISAQEVTERTADELRQEICSFIQHNDVKACADVSFSGTDITAGMEMVLWYCPHCHSRNTLKMDKNTVRCDTCGTEKVFTPNLQIEAPAPKEPRDFYDWYKAQTELVQQDLSAISSTPDRHLIHDSHVSQVKVDYKGRVIMLDTGELDLYGNTLVFSGQDGVQTFPLADLFHPVFQGKNILEFDCNNSDYQFRFTHTALSQWLSYLLYLKGYGDWERTGYIFQQ
ncbi:1-acyl-sn-glycerol-3-phosphate acyltransferase [Chitinivibrio alkaliphilus ACht1]|uniref:1-acyl-sn-glycerol-3-phosphate acyltransferase n=1 Tax=Chitinivibrio alkaliphilus ACht1 TaxID=1313304 RepID=U7D718_9BACT|nr:1-acyl-sn-glycerol-3-phosphate acyltransferase [Chitinivibrio alkaliphilus ACht1]